jgi:hypothetical protein
MNHTNARAAISGNPHRDGRDNTKGKRPLFKNRDIKFPGADTFTEEERALIQNLNSDVTMLEEETHIEQYLTWRSKEIERANHWWIDGFDRPFWST